MNKGSILVIGGSGIIGSETCNEAVEQGYEVASVALEYSDDLPADVTQLIGDVREGDFGCVARKLTTRKWDMVFNIVSYTHEDVQRTFEYFAPNAKHIALLSTTLVYDRTQPSTKPIASDHLLARKGVMGGYVDGKLKVEEACRESDAAQWTLLRPYHVLGKRSPIGCLPNHNRDASLLQKMRHGTPLELCEGGACDLNVVHPRDIARTVLAIIGKKVAFRKAYNVVNPSIITGTEYYQEVGKQIGVQPIIIPVSMREVWDRRDGWELTTLPHIYDTSDLEADLGFVPSISYQQCLKDALSTISTDAGIPSVHERMKKLPRPERIDWLIDNADLLTR